jgi:hypothetical protein
MHIPVSFLVQNIMSLNQLYFELKLLTENGIFSIWRTARRYSPFEGPVPILPSVADPVRFGRIRFRPLKTDLIRIQSETGSIRIRLKTH